MARVVLIPRLKKVNEIFGMQKNYGYPFYGQA